MEVINIGHRLFDAIGEGPHYDLAKDELFLVDSPNIESGGHGRLLRKRYSDPKAEFETYDTGNTITSFIIPTVNEKFVIGFGKQIAEVDWPENGDPVSKTILYTLEEEKRTNFNDGKCDHRGRIWTGTMSEQKEPGVVYAHDVGSLYSINKDKTVKEWDEKYTLSNGLAWTSDEKYFFSVDSIMKKVFVYDYDPDKFTATNRRVFYDTAANGDQGSPDGCTIDTDNRLWVALFGGSSIICIDTTTGKKCNTINIPAKQVTSCCFAGPNLDELVVTTCRALASAEDVEAGSLFRVRNMGAKGVPMVKFDG